MSDGLTRTWLLLQEIAARGERCPASRVAGGDGFTSGHLPALARAGLIRIEVSGRNWRTVIILSGPHAGKSTAPDPSGSKAFMVITKDTPVFNHGPRDMSGTKARRMVAPPAELPPPEIRKCELSTSPQGGGGSGSSFIRPLTKAQLMRGRA